MILYVAAADNISTNQPSYNQGSVEPSIFTTRSSGMFSGCARSGALLRSSKKTIYQLRWYSNPAYEVFDRNSKRLQKDRAAQNPETSRKVEYLRDEIASRIAERLSFVSRPFSRVLDLGSWAGNIEKCIADPQTPESQLIQSRLGKITMLESSEKFLYRDADPEKFEFNKKLELERIVGDEENLLSHFREESFDAVVSSLSMHWINDLPGVLDQIRHILVPDGMFMAAMIGGDSLYELRTSLQLAEMERCGRISPRLSPLADVKDVGGLLQKAKFNLLTVDVDDIIVSYPDMFALMEDLQDMGESNAVKIRQANLPRDVLTAASEIYRGMHGDEHGVPATFRIIYMIGWKPSPNQPQPLKRGSADINLNQVLPEFNRVDEDSR